MTQMSFDFENARPVLQTQDSNDYHILPASAQQLRFARQIASRHRKNLPEAVLQDRRKLSEWIDANKGVAPSAGRFARYPSSKQVAFAERIARVKQRSVPDECFRDKMLMSRWIDSNR